MRYKLIQDMSQAGPCAHCGQPVYPGERALVAPGRPDVHYCSAPCAGAVVYRGAPGRPPKAPEPAVA